MIFIFSAISSAFCGELFFLEGISDLRNDDELKKTYDVGKIRSYDERIFILAFLIIFMPFIYFLIFTGFNSEFLKLFLIPINIFIVLYLVIFLLTDGEYYNHPAKHIKLTSWGIIISIFLYTFLSSSDFVVNNIFDLFQIEKIDINIQINNFIKTFF